MKSLKTLGLAAVVAAALTGLIGPSTASATTLTNSSGTHWTLGTTVHATSEIVILDSVIGNIECHSTVHGETTVTGGNGQIISIRISTLSFTSCNSTVVVLVNGELEIIGTGSNNGELRSSGTRVTIEKSGFHCIFETSNTKIGTVTGSSTTGSTSSLDISANIPRVGGRSGAFCGSSAPWTGSYSIDSPDFVNVDA